MASKDADPTFTFDTVACLVANILAKGGSLGMEDYRRMSALDGTRGASGFDHMFRKVKQRAKELNRQAEADGDMTPVKKTKGVDGVSASKKKDESASTGKKRACNPKSDEAGGAEDDAEQSPSKKVKAEKAEDSDADATEKPNYDFDFD